MSWEANSWAVKIGHEKGLSPTQRHILLILANRSDEQGYVYPSYSWIVKATGYAHSTVRTAISTMEQMHLLTKTQRAKEDGGQTSNLYLLQVEQPGLDLGKPNGVPIVGRGVPIAGRGGAGERRGGVPIAGTLYTKEEKKDDVKRAQRFAPRSRSLEARNKAAVANWVPKEDDHAEQ